MIAAFELPNRVSTVSAETVAQIGFVPKRVDRKETVGRNRPQRKKKKAQRGRGGEYNDWFNGPSVVELKGYLKYIRAREPDSDAAKIKLSQKKSDLAKAFAADTSNLLTPEKFAAWKANETISTVDGDTDEEVLEDITTGIDTDNVEQEASLASDQALVDIAAGIDADSFIEQEEEASLLGELSNIGLPDSDESDNAVLNHNDFVQSAQVSSSEEEDEEAQQDRLDAAGTLVDTTDEHDAAETHAASEAVQSALYSHSVAGSEDWSDVSFASANESQTKAPQPFNMAAAVASIPTQQGTALAQSEARAAELGQVASTVGLPARADAQAAAAAKATRTRQMKRRFSELKELGRTVSTNQKGDEGTAVPGTKWVRYEDKDGDPYYHNTKTDEVVWNIPGPTVMMTAKPGELDVSQIQAGLAELAEETAVEARSDTSQAVASAHHEILSRLATSSSDPIVKISARSVLARMDGAPPATPARSAAHKPSLDHSDPDIVARGFNTPGYSSIKKAGRVFGEMSNDTPIGEFSTNTLLPGAKDGASLIAQMNHDQMIVFDSMNKNLKRALVADRRLDAPDVPNVVSVIQAFPEIGKLIEQGLVRPDQLTSEQYVADLKKSLSESKSTGAPGDMRGRIRQSSVPVFKRTMPSRRTSGLNYYKPPRFSRPNIFA